MKAHNKSNKQNNYLDPNNTIWIKDKGYHAAEDGSLFKDENGNRIPKYICLCFAHDSSECMCGAWSFGLPEKYYL